ncbi:glycosyltransferase family 4 protein [Gordonibacter massiliensis (ex Traore et al. 2017)]|uniref:glycosyltransferase family 4 protein n=1 Tax=Gordonibacter massiliensis (ex Traore et al. 2017) TaxID=1841863 RepID=UPI001C8CDADD|nr:glycosyltransferase family 4 protein [Gordonibacter massiliensis (ex Traore et al. 2017)]
MRVLTVCQHYWPEDFQITAVCEELVRRGHEVTVLAGLPNYPSGVVPEEYHRGCNRRQEKDGVSIVRSFEIGRKPGPLRLALNYYSYARSATRIAKSMPGDFDAVFAYQLSPVMMAEPAVAYKERTGAPLLLYCCDLWPESMKVMLGDRFPFLLKHYEKVSGEIYGQADLLAVQSSAFSDYFAQVHGIPAKRVRYVPQFAPSKFLDEDFSCNEHSGVNFALMGNIGRAQSIPCILEAVAKMRHDNGFAVHFVGDGACLQEARDLVRRYSLEDRVVFHGRRPFSEMPSYYQMADACLLALDGSTWVGATLPSRLQGYMAAGKPIIAAINGGARHVIEESGCGRAVDAGDSDGLAALMDGFVDDPEAYSACGGAGRRYFREHFMKEQHMDAIEGLLRQIADGRQGV